MNIGLKISDSVKILIGESKDDLIKRLSKAKIEYNIIYDKDTNGKNIVILLIESLGLELDVSNGCIKSIKSSRNRHNALLICNDMKPLDVLKGTIAKIAELFETNESDIKVERFYTDKLGSVLSVKCADGTVKVTTALSIGRTIVIEAIRLVEE